MSVTELISNLHLKDSVTFTLNSEFLNHNFQIVRQCLLKIKDLEGAMQKSAEFTGNIESQLKELQEKVGENSQQIVSHSSKIKELDSNVGDEFMKKMYGIEEKTKNMFDFTETVRRLEELDKFVLITAFEEDKNEIHSRIDNVWRLKEEFERYLPHIDFENYKREQSQLFDDKQNAIDKASSEISTLSQKVTNFAGSLDRMTQEMDQNNNMIRQINFVEMIEKLKKMKEENEGKLTQFSVKLKKKVGITDLFSFEKIMIEKLDNILGDNQKNKAEKAETKDALLFLQKKIVDLESYILEKIPQEEKDALFSSKKWQCASCTKDLGRYEGKLGQYRPWSIFPCKQPDTEKSGGFGYLNYIDKMAYKKGYDLQDQSLERLSKTFNDPKDTPRKLNSTRASNVISNFGSEERRSSIKDAYFRDISSQKGQRTKQFRVLKKEGAKATAEQEKKLQQKDSK